MVRWFDSTYAVYMPAPDRRRQKVAPSVQRSHRAALMKDIFRTVVFEFCQKLFRPSFPMTFWAAGTTRGGRNDPAALAHLEMEDQSSGWLRCVRPGIRAQACESEIWILINKTSVFRPQRQVSREGIIGSGTVQERASSLIACARHKSATVARGIKDQSTASSERVRANPPKTQWKFRHHIRSDYVHIGLDSGLSKTAAEIFLSVSIETIIPFGREPAVDVIAVSHLEPARVCAGPRNSVAAGILREKACALQADLRAAFLGRGAKS